MNKEFIPYEQALALKELGFDEECLASWSPKTRERIPTLYGCGALLYDVDGLITNKTEDILCSAPLYSQAFRWVRKEHKYEVSIKKQTKYTYQFLIENKEEEEHTRFVDFPYKTHEEAQFECLKKLIEIVKTK